MMRIKDYIGISLITIFMITGCSQSSNGNAILSTSSQASVSPSTSSSSIPEVSEENTYQKHAIPSEFVQRPNDFADSIKFYPQARFVPTQPVVGKISTEDDCMGFLYGDTKGGDLLSSLITDEDLQAKTKRLVYTPNYVRSLSELLTQYTREKYQKDPYAFYVCHLDPNTDLVAARLWPTQLTPYFISKISPEQQGLEQPIRGAVKMEFSFTSASFFRIDMTNKIVDEYPAIQTINQSANGTDAYPCEARGIQQDIVEWQCVYDHGKRYWFIPSHGGTMRYSDHGLSTSTQGLNLEYPFPHEEIEYDATLRLTPNLVGSDKVVYSDYSFQEGGDILSTLLLDPEARASVPFDDISLEQLHALKNKVRSYAKDTHQASFIASAFHRAGDGIFLFTGMLIPEDVSQRIVSVDDVYTANSIAYGGERREVYWKGERFGGFQSGNILPDSKSKDIPTTSTMIIVDERKHTIFEIPESFSLPYRGQTFTGAEAPSCGAKVAKDRKAIEWSCPQGFNFTNGEMDGVGMRTFFIPLDTTNIKAPLKMVDSIDRTSF